MNKDEVERCLAEYAKRGPVYGRLAEAVRALLAKLAEQRGVATHSIQAREKDPRRLRDKLSRPTRGYKLLTEVTDLAGVRVITYFSDQVDEIARIVEDEFEIMPEHSIDRRKAVEPDRFGYASLHYVCKLSPQRLALAEYKEYKGMLVEIQIRTVLQHAWAEIEHDLGYKTEAEVPYHIRRKFSRLAGVLELADDEFLSLRKGLDAYKEGLPERIDNTPGEVTIDKPSVWELIKTDPTVQELDLELARAADATPTETWYELVEDTVEMFCSVGMTHLEELVTALRDRKASVLQIGRRVLEGQERDEIPVGFCLRYLYVTMLAEKGDPDALKLGLERFNVGDPDRRESLAQELARDFAKA